MKNTLPNPLPRYDIQKTYRWNYDHPPDPVQVDVPPSEFTATFAGLPAVSPLGVAAGPLLCGRWLLYYASLGFDVLTYKTVRSGHRQCYPLPNLVHVPDVQPGQDSDVVATDANSFSWAVSFGMPSASPEDWRRDIEATRQQLADEKLLSVSVVGTVQAGWSLDDLAEDYARCARWAIDSGADTIEANLSCPNVDTCDGQLYQRPDDAAVVASAIRREIGRTPLILKVGHVLDQDLAVKLLMAVQPTTTALAMTNSIAARVRRADATELFDGQPRGICGKATLDASCQQTAMFSRLIDHLDLNIGLIGVGGAGTAEDVNRYLASGADAVHLATAAMLDPAVAIKIKTQWIGQRDPSAISKQSGS
jgi:dihydroorotate dehydrogenase